MSKTKTQAKNKYPTIFLYPEASAKIDTWCKIAKGEVSGLGLVEVDDDGDIFITDAFLLTQESSTAHTELDQAAVGELMQELREKEIPGSKLRLWWHSHGTGSTFWSGTDDKTIDLLANDGFMVSLVTNKRREKLFRIGMRKPLLLDLDNLEWSVAYMADEDLEKKCQEEFDAKVTETTTFVKGKGQGRTSQWSGRGYGGYHGGNHFDGFGPWEPYEFSSKPQGNSPKQLGVGNKKLELELDDGSDAEVELNTPWLILSEANYNPHMIDMMLKRREITAEEHKAAIEELNALGLGDE